MACQIEINPQFLGDWTEVANVSRSASLNESGKPQRIPAFSLDISIDKRFVAVQVTSVAAKSTWIAGGYIAQQYNFPGFSVTLNSHYLKLNSINLVELKENANYPSNLIFYPRTYFEDVQVIVWKYLGEEISFLEDILTDIQQSVDNISLGEVDLSEIINKLNTISQNLDNSYLDLADDLSDVISQIVVLQDSLSNIDFNFLTQLNQLDAGVFTLFQALKNLITSNESNELETALKARLDLNEEFL
ncbi:MAG: hypothetical protein QNJ65_15605 [Xenococcaceae cyanobacterium MO_234.B1]|nr:hypothetical protein [Xenococcaceae cyanobacterium MO_234.B1]